MQALFKHALGPQNKNTPTKTPSKQDQQNGATVIGQYLLGKSLGQGAFGKVHLALHIPTSERVAVKIISKSKMRPKDIGRVKLQITILSKVHHSNLIQMYQVIETPRSLLLIMEYISGGLSEERACHFFQQLLAGVEYLHKNKIAHRDIKPQNLLIEANDKLKIIDFGLSASFQYSSHLKQSCGSPCYASPQVLSGKPYLPQPVDVWSCGVVLYTMLCGYLPFCSKDQNELFNKIKNCEYIIPPNISAGAKNLLQNLLVANPSKRYTIQQIKQHEWYNKTDLSFNVGVNFNQKLKLQTLIVQQMQKMNLPNNQIIESLHNLKHNQQTACYYILMRKLTRQGKKVLSYVGSNHFDFSYICSDIEADTDSQTQFQSLSAPQMQQQYNEPLLSGNPEDCQHWSYSETIQNQKTFNPQILKQFTRGILQLYSSSLTLLQIKEQNKDNYLQKQQLQFYKNLQMKKSKILLKHNLFLIRKKNNTSTMKNIKKQDETRLRILKIYGNNYRQKSFHRKIKEHKAPLIQLQYKFNKSLNVEKCFKK